MKLKSNTAAPFLHISIHPIHSDWFKEVDSDRLVHLFLTRWRDGLVIWQTRHLNSGSAHGAHMFGFLTFPTKYQFGTGSIISEPTADWANHVFFLVFWGFSLSVYLSVFTSAATSTSTWQLSPKMYREQREQASTSGEYAQPRNKKISMLKPPIRLKFRLKHLWSVSALWREENRQWCRLEIKQNFMSLVRSRGEHAGKRE